MSKCTGKRCPMQVGFDVSKCQAEDCSYRTEPMTNYDRIRNMSVEELAEFIKLNSVDDAVWVDDYEWIASDEIKQWLEMEVIEG